MSAAFYRRSAVLNAGGFSEVVGDDLTDLDLALSLQAIGYQTAIEQDSIALATDLPPAPRVQDGRCSERLFLRHALHDGGLASLLAHPPAVLAQWFVQCYRPSAYKVVLERLLAGLEIPAYRRHYQAIREAAEMVQADLAAAENQEEAEPLLLPLRPLTARRRAA